MKRTNSKSRDNWRKLASRSWRSDLNRRPHSTTTIEAPTVLSWGFFSSDGDSSRVFARVHADACGLRRLPVWPVLGRFSLSPGHSSPGLCSPRMARSPQRHSSAPFQINGLRADGSSGWIAALPTRRGTAAARRLPTPFPRLPMQHWWEPPVHPLPGDPSLASPVSWR